MSAVVRVPSRSFPRPHVQLGVQEGRVRRSGATSLGWPDVSNSETKEHYDVNFQSDRRSAAVGVASAIKVAEHERPKGESSVAQDESGVFPEASIEQQQNDSRGERLSGETGGRRHSVSTSIALDAHLAWLGRRCSELASWSPFDSHTYTNPPPDAYSPVLTPTLPALPPSGLTVARRAARRVRPEASAGLLDDTSGGALRQSTNESAIRDSIQMPWETEDSQPHNTLPCIAADGVVESKTRGAVEGSLPIDPSGASAMAAAHGRRASATPILQKGQPHPQSSAATTGEDGEEQEGKGTRTLQPPPRAPVSSMPAAIGPGTRPAPIQTDGSTTALNTGSTKVKLPPIPGALQAGQSEPSHGSSDSSEIGEDNRPASGLSPARRARFSILDMEMPSPGAVQRQLYPATPAAARSSNSRSMAQRTLSAGSDSGDILSERMASGDGTGLAVGSAQERPAFWADDTLLDSREGLFLGRSGGEVYLASASADERGSRRGTGGHSGSDHSEGGPDAGSPRVRFEDALLRDSRPGSPDPVHPEGGLRKPPPDLADLELGLPAVVPPARGPADANALAGSNAPSRHVPAAANSQSSGEDGTVWGVMGRVAHALWPTAWSWACCGRMRASGLALAVLETWQIAGLILTRPGSAGSGTGYMAFWGGLASVLGLDFAPAFSWGQAPTLFLLLASLVLCIAFVATAEFCIQPASSEEQRIAAEKALEGRGRSASIDSSSLAGADRQAEDLAARDAAAPVYSPRFGWMVTGLRWVIFAFVTALAFASIREGFDVVSCHPRTGRDLVRTSAAGVGVASFQQDSPVAQAAAAASSTVASNGTDGNTVASTVSEAVLLFYLQVMRETAPAACLPQFPGVSHLAPTGISIEGLLLQSDRDLQRFDDVAVALLEGRPGTAGSRQGPFREQWSCDCLLSDTYQAAYLPAGTILLLLVAVGLPVYLWIGIHASAPGELDLPPVPDELLEAVRRAKSDQSDAGSGAAAGQGGLQLAKRLQRPDDLDALSAIGFDTDDEDRGPGQGDAVQKGSIAYSISSLPHTSLGAAAGSATSATSSAAPGLVAPGNRKAAPLDTTGDEPLSDEQRGDSPAEAPPPTMADPHAMQRLQSAQRRKESFLDQAYLEALESDPASRQSPFFFLYGQYHRRWKYAPVARLAYLVVLVGLCEGLHSSPAAALVMTALVLLLRTAIGFASARGARVDMIQCACSGCRRRCGDGCASVCCPGVMPRCCFCSCCWYQCGVIPRSEYDVRVPACRRQPVVGLVETVGALSLAISSLLLASAVPQPREDLPSAYEVNTAGAVLVGLLVSVVLAAAATLQVLAAASMVVPREWGKLEHAVGLSRLRFSLFGTGIDQLAGGDVIVHATAGRDAPLDEGTNIARNSAKGAGAAGAGSSAPEEETGSEPEGGARASKEDRKPRGHGKRSSLVSVATPAVPLSGAATNEAGGWHLTSAHRMALAGFGWDLAREVPRRFWYSFWDALLGYGYGREVGRRWREVKAQVKAAGGDGAAKLHAAGSLEPRVRALRRWVMQHAEGPDVFYDGSLEDGSQPSKSCFGSLRVDPWPFRCTVAYDDANAHVVLRDRDLEALKARNIDNGIVARRQVREQVRALHGCEVRYVLERQEAHVVEDGEEIYIDQKTLRPRTLLRQSTVQVDVRYSTGMLRLKRRQANDPASPGFGVSIHMTGGRGIALAPHTKRHVVMDECQALLGHEELQIQPTFQVTQPLRELLFDPDNQLLVQQRLPATVTGLLARMRLRKMQHRMDEDALVDPELYVYVYRNLACTPAVLREHVSGRQPRSALAGLCEEHANGLVFLFGRTRMLCLSPVAQVWMVFFDDVWRNNSAAPGVAANADLFDIRLPWSVAYRPMPRRALERLLESRGLLGGLFSESLLDALYLCLEAFLFGAGPESAGE